jgi:catalase
MSGAASWSLWGFTVIVLATLYIRPGLAAQEATPQQLVDALHTAFGEHHARAVHAKGIILEGTFRPAVSAAALTSAPHLQKTDSKVVVRFSDFTGIPDIPDNVGGANPRGFAIKFTLPDGMNTDIVGHSFDGFPTPNPTEFRELLLAIGAGGDAVPHFLESHPVAKTFLTTQKTPASFATISYFGVNSFKLTNAKGMSRYIRYQFLPEAGEQLISPDALAKAGPQYLMSEIKTRVERQKIGFKMFAQISEEGDEVGNPSIAWPAARTKVLLGTVTIDKLAANTEATDKALRFIPNNLPRGIETADPMLDFRSRAYPISADARQ